MRRTLTAALAATAILILTEAARAETVIRDTLQLP